MAVDTSPLFPSSGRQLPTHCERFPSPYSPLRSDF